MKRVLLDEPTANPSASLGNRFLEQHGRSDVSVALVEQRAVEAISIADTTNVMVSGSIVRSDPASTFSDKRKLANLFLAGAANGHGAIR